MDVIVRIAVRLDPREPTDPPVWWLHRSAYYPTSPFSVEFTVLYRTEGHTVAFETMDLVACYRRNHLDLRLGRRNLRVLRMSYAVTVVAHPGTDPIWDPMYSVL